MKQKLNDSCRKKMNIMKYNYDDDNDDDSIMIAIFQH